MNRNKFLPVLAACLLAAILITGCTPAPSGSAGSSAPSGGAAAPAGRSDVIIAQTVEPSSLDPHNCYELTAMRVYMNMFDALIRADADGQLHPSLAESWTISDDGKTYTFNLRQDVKFHNGDPFGAADVKYSFERAMASPYCLEATEPMESVEVVDDYTVAVKLRFSYPPQLNFFSTTYLSVINKNVVEARGGDFSINPAGAGTGAYQFSEWKKGVSVTMTANEYYFGGKPAIDTVVYRVIPEESAGAIAVESGDVDIFLQPSTVDVPNLRNNPNLTVYEAESYYCEYLAINMNIAPFDQLDVRRALSMAIDKNDIILAAVDGIGGAATGTVVSSRSFGYDPSLAEPYPYDPEKAKQLLADAGFPNGFDCSIETVDGARKKVAEAYQAALAAIGVNAAINVVENGTFWDDAAKGASPLYVVGMTALPADADPILNSCFSSTAVGATNFSFYDNQKFQALLDAERGDSNPDSRAETLRQMQQIIYNDVPVIPSYFRVTIGVCNKDLKGFQVESHNLFYADTLSW
jgi:peptide/nickel transport system substrate-binding protein